MHLSVFKHRAAKACMNAAIVDENSFQIFAEHAKPLVNNFMGVTNNQI
jgi:hypothetical protein